jgi:hypothetical protein
MSRWIHLRKELFLFFDNLLYIVFEYKIKFSLFETFKYHKYHPPLLSLKADLEEI